MNKMLPVQLKPDELRIKSEELVKKLDELDEIECDLKLARQAAKAKADEIRERINELRDQLKHKTEDRPVECEETKNTVDRTMDTIRLDTGEVVFSRPFSNSDIQSELFSVPARPAKPKEVK